MTATKDVQTPTAKAEIKEERAREAAKAMQDYQAERRAVLARTARLRAQRLEREAADALQAEAKGKENH
jgi:hypothetical protein